MRGKVKLQDKSEREGLSTEFSHLSFRFIPYHPSLGVHTYVYELQHITTRDPAASR
jgi:hypothetical protein